MADIKTFITDWLDETICKDRAQMKYEIRHLERLLDKALDERQSPYQNQEVSALCEALCRCYGNYLQRFYYLMDNDSFTDRSFLLAHDWRSCYKKIQLLKHEWAKTATSEDAIHNLRTLLKHYQYLLAFFAENRSSSAEEIKVNSAVQSLLQARSPGEWLHAVVDFANEYNEINHHDHFLNLIILDDEQLEQLANVFGHQDYIHIVSVIFFYKLYPEKLIKETLHPEKLVSVKARLSLLYDFIEALYRALVQLLAQRGLPGMHDYLLHNEELPQGIEITNNEEYSALILSVVKSWRSNTCPVGEEQKPGVGRLREVARAYKFWFNPNRLIDASMMLWQEFELEAKEKENLYFYQQMRILYSGMTTTECLDLYGYFANKDSCYLMRTLLAVKNNMQLSWLSDLCDKEKNAVKRVYEILESIMDALREELVSRHITTPPYQRTLPTDGLTPGRRNRDAVIRLVHLYGYEIKENNTIERLFSVLEAPCEQ